MAAPRYPTLYQKMAAAMLLAAAAWFAGSAAALMLPAGLASPDHGMVCNQERAMCYDRYGPSIGLTEAFLGMAAAEGLTAALRERPADQRPGAVFSPADGVECVRETGPCRINGEPDTALTPLLYESRPQPTDLSADARAILGADWRWLGTRYNNDTEARPAEPARYTLRLEPDGSVAVQADCNGAGGQYRMEESRITVEITHSTLAVCEPGSLDGVFLRDLAAAASYFMKNGRLYLDLNYDTGTMEFAR